MSSEQAFRIPGSLCPDGPETLGICLSELDPTITTTSPNQILGRRGFFAETLFFDAIPAFTFYFSLAARGSRRSR